MSINAPISVFCDSLYSPYFITFSPSEGRTKETDLALGHVASYYTQSTQPWRELEMLHCEDCVCFIHMNVYFPFKQELHLFPCVKFMSEVFTM